MKIKFWEENCFKKLNVQQNSIYSKIVIYGKIRNLTAGGYNALSPSLANPSAAKFASQGDVHVRADA